MMLSEKNYFLFDMDGTLIDSEPIGPDTFKEVFTIAGYIPRQAEIEQFTQSWRRLGEYTPQDEYIRDLASRELIDGEKLLEAFYDLYRENLLHAKPLKCADEFIKKAFDLNKTLVVVSASTIEQIKTVLSNNKWQDLFKLIVGADQISTHKPSPEGYLFAINELGVTSEECVVFEDSTNGVLAGKASGSLTIGLRAGNSEKIDLSNSDYIFESFEELLAEI